MLISLELLSIMYATELLTITISVESLRFSVLYYSRTLKAKINLPFPVIVQCGAVLSLS